MAGADRTHGRWLQLAAGIAAMMVISNYQYAFGPVFSLPLQREFSLSKPQAQSVFFLFTLCQTLPVALAGRLSERFGARPVALAGGLLMGLGWAWVWAAGSLTGLRLGYGVTAGLGVGMMYITILANAIKWFPDRRGLAAGLTIFGFGTGAAFSIVPLEWSVMNWGIRSTFLYAGAVHAVICVAAALPMRYPPEGWSPPGWDPAASPAVELGAKEYPWTQAVPTAGFGLLFLSFTLASSIGLFLTSNLGDIARSLGHSGVAWGGVSVAAAAATAASVMNGCSRIFWGKVSDRFGRENVLAASLLLCAASVFLLSTSYASRPLAFVAFCVLVFWNWGQVFVLFSAATGDAFGARNSATNFGIMYVGKMLGSLIGSVGAAALASAHGSYTPVFYIFTGAGLLVCGLMLAAKPVLRRLKFPLEAA